MDKLRDHIIWLEKLYEVGAVDKDAYIYELTKIGHNEGFMSNYLANRIEKKTNEES